METVTQAIQVWWQLFLEQLTQEFITSARSEEDGSGRFWVVCLFGGGFFCLFVCFFGGWSEWARCLVQQVQLPMSPGASFLPAASLARQC